MTMPMATTMVSASSTPEFAPRALLRALFQQGLEHRPDVGEDGRVRAGQRMDAIGLEHCRGFGAIGHAL